MNLLVNKEILDYNELRKEADFLQQPLDDEISSITDSLTKSDTTGDAVIDISSSFFYSIVEQILKLYQVFFGNYNFNFLNTSEGSDSGFIYTIIFITSLALPGSIMLLAVASSKTNFIYKIIIAGILGFISFITLFVVKQDLITLGLLIGVAAVLVMVLSLSIFRIIFAGAMLIFSFFSAKYFYDTSSIFAAEILPSSNILNSFEQRTLVQILLTLIILSPFIFAGLTGTIYRKLG